MAKIKDRPAGKAEDRSCTLVALNLFKLELKRSNSSKGKIVVFTYAFLDERDEIAILTILGNQARMRIHSIRHCHSFLLYQYW